MSLIDAAGYADLPHLIRSHRYANRVMPWPEFEAREALASLRSSFARTGGMRYLSSTGVSMNLTNRLRVEFGFDDDGLIAAQRLQEAIELLVRLHAWAHTVDAPECRGTLRDEMRRVVGGDYPFPSRGVRRGPRRPKPSSCWWNDPSKRNVH